MEFLVQVTEQHKENVRKAYNTDSAKIKEQCEILKSWIKQQRHLPSNQDDNLLEHFLLRNKFRIEQTKMKIEAYYTLKGIHREFFEDDYSHIIPSTQTIVSMPMPILSKDNARIYIISWTNPDPEAFNLIDIMKYSVLGLEMVLRYDYSRGEKIIVDFSACTMEHVKKMNVAEIYKFFQLYEKGFSGRVLTVELINAPSFINVILGIMRMAFSPKIYSKIKVHPNLESLIETHTKACLPEDFGGDLESISSLLKKWDPIFVEKQKFFKFCSTNVADEKLRVGEVRKDANFGVDGTFKKLTLD